MIGVNGRINQRSCRWLFLLPPDVHGEFKFRMHVLASPMQHFPTSSKRAIQHPFEKMAHQLGRRETIPCNYLHDPCFLSYVQFCGPPSSGVGRKGHVRRASGMCVYADRFAAGAWKRARQMILWQRKTSKSKVDFASLPTFQDRSTRNFDVIERAAIPCVGSQYRMLH
jgi:hypothetical protein